MTNALKSKKILRSNGLIVLMCLLVLLGMAASLWQQSRLETVERPAMRTVDVERIDREIGAGRLSDMPARHWIVIEEDAPK